MGIDRFFDGVPFCITAPYQTLPNITYPQLKESSSMKLPRESTPEPLTPHNVNRRNFLAQSAAGATVATTLTAAATSKAAKASDRIRSGFIGPGGRGFGAHVKTLVKLRNEGANIDLVAVSEVYKAQEDKVCEYIKAETGVDPKRYLDYQDMLADDSVDAVCIGTPDHWHRIQIVDALKAGKHVYAEKPMTKTVDEALDVVKVWKDTSPVMQVVVQYTNLPVWCQARQLI
ncbi:MAG: Gfo/Idh/MocA family oxidoreductase [Pirellulales bacterium]|nr:Gfo/Idh/MocA family oxidoreductase [Pirellulales bacterium]